LKYFIVLVLLIIIGWSVMSKQVGEIPSRQRRKGYTEHAANFDGNRFSNIDGDNTMITGKRDCKSARRFPSSSLPIVKPDYAKLAKMKSGFIWFGHSSFLLRLDGKNIMVDPVFSSYASPIRYKKWKRYSANPVNSDKLPKIDFVFISHDHYDHLDYDSVKKIDRKVAHYIVPLGVESYLESWGIARKKIISLGWREETEIDGIRFVLTESRHYSMRNPLKPRATLWGGCKISGSDMSVYYSGDGGYGKHFADIGKSLGGCDVAFMECGQYDKGWAKAHMFPEETVRAAQDVKAKLVIPLHWGAYSICLRAWDDSVRRFVAAANKKQLNFCIPKIGEAVDFANVSATDSFWWQKVK